MSVILTMGLLWFDVLPINRIPLLLIVNIKDVKYYDAVISILNKYTKDYKIKTRNHTKGNINIVFELDCKKQEELVAELSKVKNIESFNLIYQDGSCDV